MHRSSAGIRPSPHTLPEARRCSQRNAPPATCSQDAIGPPLGGITALLPKDRLVEWIKDPAKVRGSGDVRANALLRRYKVPMPPFALLTPSEVDAVLSFIDQQSSEQHLQPFAVDLAVSAAPVPRWAAPIKRSGITIEVEDIAQIPRLPGRTPYKGITLLHPDPRERGVLLVDELMGLLYRVKDHQVSVFLDLRGTFPEFICDPGVATGLGSFALHPDFIHNGVFYTSHAENFRNSPAINSADIPTDVPASSSPRLEWVITEWRLQDPTTVTFFGTHREVLRFVTPTTAHAAQEIAFAPVTDVHDPDYAKLYIGIGDGGSANLKRPDMAGHPRTLLGSIIRIDPAGQNGVTSTYGIPSDNPFFQSADSRVHREIWAYGFRNPHRLSWDFRYVKRMIAVDIGESNVEEVNLIEKGGAYGWGSAGIEGRTRVDVKVDAKIVRPATATELQGIHLPVSQYDHVDGAAITGGYVYNGPLAELRGKYIFGDIVRGRVLYMTMDTELNDPTIYELNLIRDGAATSLKALAHAERAHLRIGYDDRTGDLYFLTKDDGMIRRVTSAYVR